LHQRRVAGFQAEGWGEVISERRDAGARLGKVDFRFSVRPRDPRKDRVAGFQAEGLMFGL